MRQGNSGSSSSIPAAVSNQKMSALPASRIRLGDRGRIAPRLAADIVVFDPSTVTDKATYEDPFQYPVGIKAVVVNGKVELRDGQRSNSAAGRALKPNGGLGTRG